MFYLYLRMLDEKQHATPGHSGVPAKLYSTQHVARCSDMNGQHVIKLRMAVAVLLSGYHPALGLSQGHPVLPGIAAADSLHCGGSQGVDTWAKCQAAQELRWLAGVML